ncbi:MAG: hypothetical protein GY880_03955 [Planctomycetaceae bacterium]|nr:hypothetical protein [Planctomycetaceae bacterium]
MNTIKAYRCIENSEEIAHLTAWFSAVDRLLRRLGGDEDCMLGIPTQTHVLPVIPYKFSAEGWRRT